MRNSPLHSLLSVNSPPAGPEWGAHWGRSCRMPHHAAHQGLIGDHALDLRLIRLVDQRIAIELALALGSLGSQDVALHGMTTLDLPGSRFLEALCRSTMCFQLRHNRLSITTQSKATGQSLPLEPPAVNLPLWGRPACLGSYCCGVGAGSGCGAALFSGLGSCGSFDA